MQTTALSDHHSCGRAEHPLPQTLICFSHLRWDFVLQRPQHILSRMGRQMRVLYIEEPVTQEISTAYYERLERGKNLTVLVPHLPTGLNSVEELTMQRQLFDELMNSYAPEETAFWYYTPMALPFTRHVKPMLTIFDCMDELSAFRFAPQELKDLEKELLGKADIVFTGGQSLYEAKKNKHQNIHLFPSSIDKQHFAQARELRQLRKNDRFTLGFYGVIDERFDIELIRSIAKQRPDWDIVLIGPVVKVDPAILPFSPNIHYTGPKTYEELPVMISTWDVALIPFLINESTRFISPTKTPEYLAAGLPVISTPICDVVFPYGEHQLVQIGRDDEEFIAQADLIQGQTDKGPWLHRVDAFLSDNSWEQTCEQMLALIRQLKATGEPINPPSITTGTYV